ncbi:MAG TPA: PAS domain S-box protein, partial [Nitrospiraceae bacterium]|nr:PAS domain S-box protein [Nitrospiraceae bacterium]
EFVNKAYLDLLGVRDVDVRGFGWKQFVHPDDRRRYVAAYRDAVVERRLFEATFRLRRHDGEYRWMKSVGTPRFTADGAFVGYVGSMLELIDMHAPTQQSGRHGTIDGRPSTGGLELTGGAGTGRRMSRTVTGYAIAVGLIVLALLVRSAIDVELGNHLPYVTFFIAVAITTWFGGLGPSLTAVVLGGIASNWYFISPRHTVWIAGSMHQVGYAAYFVVALSIVGLGQAWRKAQRRAETFLTDLQAELSIRERVEEALRQSREQLRQALQFDEAVMANMGEGLYTVDRNGVVTSLNHAAEELFGWTSAELLGRKMHDVAHYKRPDGTPFPAHECAGLQVLSHGKVLHDHEDVFIRK